MAAHSNRSPSPISSRPTNPNSRSSDIHLTTRRSFNGNNSFAKPSALANPKKLDPMTPANSPSDFARRSVGSGSCLKFPEEKENNDERDQFMKISKHQSPAKGCKSFMAPTISAASKFTPSPRKKALVERNDPVRTSISFSDGKAMFFSNVSEDIEPKTRTGYSQNPKNLTEPVQVPKPSKKVTFVDSQNANENLPDSDSLKVSCSPISNHIAPLDADPSTRPYDPKTNYLSPRPQFLYYKPNPRLNIEKMMDTEDEIVYDNFSSDSEGTQDSEKEKLEAIDSADTVIGFEDDFHLREESEKEKLEAIASADMFEGLLESLEDDRVSVDSEKEQLEAVESADRMMGLDEMDSEKEHLEAVESADRVMGLDEMDNNDVINIEKKEKKSFVFSRLMCFSIVMVMLTAGCVAISVTGSLPFEEFGLKDLSFSDLGKFYHQSIVAANSKVAELDFHGLVRRINHLTVSCASFVFNVASDLGEGEKKTSPLKYVNLTDLQIGSWNGDHFWNTNDKVISGGLAEIVEDDDEFDEEMETEMDDAEEEETFAEDENFENEIDEQEDDVLGIEEEKPIVLSELNSEYSEDTQSPGEIVDVPSVSADDQLAAVIIPQDQESELEAETDVLGIEEKKPIISSKLNSEYSEDTQSPGEIIDVPSVSADDQLAAVIIPRDHSADDQLGAVIIPQDQESELEAKTEVAVETEKSDGNIYTLLDQDSQSEVDSLTDSVQTPIISESSSPALEDKLPARYAKEISSIFAILAVAAFAIVVYQYKKIQNLAANVVNVQEAENKHEMYQEKALSYSQRTVDDDAIGESACPSEMSSFQNSRREGTMRASEVHSLEGKARRHQSKRESLASSSSEFTLGSQQPSYGSFTTFEKIPIKNAYGEEEIITPVRRSSRIRKFTSP